MVLDFDQIEWMGQGFSDQIFRVFSNGHSGVKIIPINMNPDVEMMYLHVVNSGK